MLDTTDPRYNPVDYNFAAPGGLDCDNFLPGLNRMREFSPVVWSEYQRGWMILGHAEVYRAFHDRRLSAVRLQLDMLREIPEEDMPRLIPNILTYVPDWIINIDAPQHTRLRKLMLHAFTKKVVKRMSPDIEATIEELMGDIKARKGEVDWVNDVAFQLPMRTIMRILGVPAEHREELLPETQHILNAFQAPVPSQEMMVAAEGAIALINRICLDEIQKRRETPRNDLLTTLVQANEQGDKLSDEELLGACQVILTAGYDTTANSAVLGLIALEKNPEQRDYFLAHPDDMVSNLQELMRYIAMSSTQTRFALEDVEYGGKHIKQGELIYLSLAAANRDPKAFPEPEQLDFTRDASDVVTFGPGIHHCLGHLLAREQVALLYKRLYEEFESVEILQENPEYAPAYAFRGVKELRVRCIERQAA